MIIVTGTVNFEPLDEVGQVKQALIKRAQRSKNDADCVCYSFS